MTDISDKLKYVIKNRDRIPDEFWRETTNLDQRYIYVYEEEGYGDYEWDGLQVALTEDGKLICHFSSGCSCHSFSEENGTFNEGEIKCAIDPTVKAFNIAYNELSKLIEDYLKESSYDHNEGKWYEHDTRIEDLYLLCQKTHKPEDIFKVQNSEIRRCLIKEVDYNKIKDKLDITIKHADKDELGHDRELIKVNINKDTDYYVKVQDRCTPREYLLSVPANMNSCKQAVAWTYDLNEEEFNPIEQT